MHRCRVDCVASTSRGSADSFVEGGSALAPVTNWDPCVCHGIVVGVAGLMCVITCLDSGRRIRWVERKGKHRDDERQNEILHRRKRSYMVKHGTV